MLLQGWRCILISYAALHSAVLEEISILAFNGLVARNIRLCKAKQKAELFTRPLMEGPEALTKIHPKSLNLKWVCKSHKGQYRGRLPFVKTSLFPISRNVLGANSLFVGLGSIWSTRDMSERQRHEGGSLWFKVEKTCQYTQILFSVHTCCKNMQMDSVFHIHITVQALRCTTKEGNGFRQATGTPKSWGQSVHITPLQLMHCSSWEKAPVPWERNA